ncbi:alpha/beta-hydrolase [Tothia fuscella]|uniref:Carboxylic ester hydrolase n=1 Tax=Tothia fuscella TaxID=1048955 RepID=A0A9P4NXW5_9PEZI|nr:alpha/beta-hydrolase [Tothia fuscella]
MIFLSFLHLALLLPLSRSQVTNVTPSADPSVDVTKSTLTLQGRYLPDWRQDAFLGIPYALPPVGELRFKKPQPIPVKSKTLVKEYGKTCMQVSDRTDMSEDCLFLNVVRPSGINASANLPVFVSIYGGGFTVGSASEPAYNLSGLVGLSTQMKQPMIGVSMNYRLDVWGFLSTPELIASKDTNAGLLDQQMAMKWIQENIASFGGDPKRVTLWGVSAGAQSIGLHLHSFGGRDQGLFHGAIMEAGGPVGTALQELPFYDKPFEDLVKANGCGNTTDKLACLRAVPAEEFYQRKPKGLWNPIVDGSYLTDFPSVMTPKSQLIKIPLMVGANSDEGASFSSRTVRSDEDIANWLKTWRGYNLSTASIDRLIEVYEPYPGPPYLVDPKVKFSGTGDKWRKSGAIGGDLVMLAGRRKLAEVWTKHGAKVWSMRFDTPMWNAKDSDGSKHGTEVVFSFQNITGLLGPLPKYKHYQHLSEGIGKAYVSFVNRFDPNPRGLDGLEAGERLLPKWPTYGERKGNMVLNANGSYVEDDTWRWVGIDFINGITRELMA